MLEQVESTIIAFLLGSVLTYFATRWSKILKKLGCDLTCDPVRKSPSLISGSKDD